MQIYGVDSTTNMKKHNITQTQKGMITGVTDVILYEGVLINLDVRCLLAETHTKYPNSRSAVKPLKKLDKILPDIKIDPQSLYKEAEKNILSSTD